MSYLDLPREIWEQIVIKADIYSAFKFLLTSQTIYSEYYPCVQEDILRRRDHYERKNKIRELAWEHIRAGAQRTERKMRNDKVVMHGYYIGSEWSSKLISTLPTRKGKIMVTHPLINWWALCIKKLFGNSALAPFFF